MIHSGLTLSEGKYFKWTGKMNTYKRVDGAVDYNDYIYWKDSLCRIVEVTGTLVTIRDLSRNKELCVNKMWLDNNKIEFKKLSKLRLFFQRLFL